MKDVARLNMFCMRLRLRVLKLSGWLKAAAAENIRSALVTAAVSQSSGWLKVEAGRESANILFVLVTRDTSHLVMCPYVAVARASFENHSLTPA